MTERDSRTAKCAMWHLAGGDPRPRVRGEGRRAPSETVESVRADRWQRRNLARPHPAGAGRGVARIVLADLAGVSQEICDLGEASVEERAHVARDVAGVQSTTHRPEPRVSHGFVDEDARVPHPESRVSEALHVRLRPPEPADQEESEARPHLGVDLSGLLAAVEARELR